MTDTFGLVMIEALACGTPVAAFPLEGPIDIITDPRAGSLDENLVVAIENALRCDRADCLRFSERFSWDKMTGQFEEAAVPISSTREFNCPTSETTERDQRTPKGSKHQTMN
jgi:glycosyltransferase involved in cell wall biosynthesis